jgi:hypothetical protein
MEPNANDAMCAQASERAAAAAENDSLRGKLADVLTQFDTFSNLVRAEPGCEGLWSGFCGHK